MRVDAIFAVSSASVQAARNATMAGWGASRRVRGLSWTDDLERARWFADRYASQLGEPAVYRTITSAEDVLAFLNVRKEREFVILPPSEVTCIETSVGVRT